MKKGRTIRFNKMVYVHNHPPIPLVDKDSNVTEPAMHKGGKVILPAMYRQDTNVTQPAMNKGGKMTLPTMYRQDKNVTEPAMNKGGKATLPAMYREDKNVTEPAMHKGGKVTLPAVYRQDTNVTEPAMHKDDKSTLPTTHTDYLNVTELARYKDGKVTLPAMHTEDGGVTKPATHTEDSNVTRPATPTEDRDVTGPAMPTEDSDVTGPAVRTKDGDVTEVAQRLVQSTITAAVDIVKEDYSTENIKWLTHGEFTPEKCRKQIEEFVRTWKYQERLVCYAKLIETRDVVHSFHYIYYVRWSLPTPQRPMIPQSAYAFFTIKFNKNKPPDAPIDVSYFFEGQSLLHRPGMGHYPENCLIYVIEAKNKLAKPFIYEIHRD
ncbi:A-kinase anchor protein 14 [Glossophaga mutica]